MQIVYINDYESSTGYSVQAIDTILAMDKVGIDIVPRSFKLATQTIKCPSRIYELEKKRIDKPITVIQHTLPNYFCYYAGFKNIGYFHCETTNFKPSNWQYYANLMDEIWVASKENYKACIDSGVIKPIKIVPKPINVDNYKKEKYDRYEFLDKDVYVFYHIGDFSSRKNTSALIRCFLETFSRYDNVVLLLKCYVEGTSSDESRNIIGNEINNIKVSLRKGGFDQYPKIILLTDYVNSDEIYKIHANGHCFITLEKGAGYNIPAHDAAAFGNWVVASQWGGQNQFIRDSVNGNLLSYEMETVSGMVRCPYPNIYTCHEEWSNPNVNEFKSLLRSIYENRPEVSLQNRGYWLNTFSYENSGYRFREYLNV